ncbi:gliding motility-associated C-terminal domain-containing protein [Bernardetia sp. ABR2-2B]|uniref:gliding motility-associated C-terminal domain-containing protein n=1 Tax=Bernardetia sp. ABR2-2B TaxID=3127472 RepID=UPI0030CC5B13
MRGVNFLINNRLKSFRIFSVFGLMLFYSFTNSSFSQITTFEYVYGVRGNEEAKKVVAIEDGYLILGTTTSFDNNSNLFLMKIDENGHLLWTQKYGNEKNEVAWDMIKTKDNNILICATTESSASGNPTNQQSLFLKVDKKGNIIWQKVYTHQSYNVPTSALLLDNGGFLITGYFAFDISTNTRDAMAMRLSEKGEIIWAKSYDSGSGTGGNEYFLQARATKNENYLITTPIGNRKYTLGGLYDNAITCIDENGKQVWAKHFGDIHNDAFEAIVPSKGNKFLVAGHYRTSANNYNMSFSFLNQRGKFEKINYFGKQGVERVFSIASTKKEKYHVLVGMTTSFGNGNKDGLALIIDSKGNYISSQTFGGKEDDILNCVIPTNDKSGFILVGKTKSFGFGREDIYIVRMNFDDKEEKIQNSCNINEIQNPLTPLDLEVKDFSFNEYISSFGNGSLMMQNEIQFDSKNLCCAQESIDETSLPNIITPNGDGKNDYLVLPLQEGSSASLVIYDRWGKMIFKSEDYQNDWNAKKLLSGTYYATLTISCTGQKMKFWIDVSK